jgi:hypothetical protein
MKIQSIKITPDNAAIAWTDGSGNEWTLRTMLAFPPAFGEALKGLSAIVASLHKHDAELLQVRSVVWSENKKGVEYVKLGGVLAAPSEDAPKKPGKFSTPKIEIDLANREAIKAMADAAIEYAKMAG